MSYTSTKKYTSTKNYTSTKKCFKTKISEEDEMFSESISLILLEAINHFNSCALRMRGDESRFFFNRKEVELVMNNLFKPDDIVCQVVTDDCGDFFCYELFRKSVVEKLQSKKK